MINEERGARRAEKLRKRFRKVSEKSLGRAARARKPVYAFARKPVAGPRLKRGIEPAKVVFVGFVLLSIGAFVF